MIKIDDLWFSYTGSPPYVLEGLQLHIDDGEYISVMGENGCGKSTLMKLMLRFLKPTRGSISMSAGRIGYVPQKKEENGGFPITVSEMLQAYRRLLKIRDRGVVGEMLERVGLSGHADALMGTLSGGQGQKALIARALLGSPQLLMLDEPSAGVDVGSQKEIYGLIKKLNIESGITIVSVEHNLGAAMTNSTRIFHIAGGRGHMCSPACYTDEYLGGRGEAEGMLSFGFMQNALIVSVFISILCPCIGVFLVLRRYSMIGDTLAHSSLAGITLGLLLDKNPVLGAFIFTSFCGALIEFLRSYFKKYTDLILTIVLSLSVGIAITVISSGKLGANADSFLFGSILTVTKTDMAMIIALSAISLLAVVLLYNQMIYITYDEEAARVAGVRVKLINYIFSILVASAVAVSIRIVGVLVLSSMIALPVATALQLGKGFRITFLFSVVFSVIDILSGLILSFYLNVAPGGFTALVSVAVLILVIAGKRVWSGLRTARKINNILSAGHILWEYNENYKRQRVGICQRQHRTGRKGSREQSSGSAFCQCWRTRHPP